MRLINIVIKEVSLVDRPASGVPFAFWKKATCEPGEPCSISFDFAKVDAEKREVFGVAYPLSDKPDLQGDYVDDAQELVKAEKTWRANGSPIWLMHREPAVGVSVVRSEITKADETVNGQFIPAGSWVVTVKVHNPELWQAVKDRKIRGYSIAGRADAADPVKSIETETRMCGCKTQKNEAAELQEMVELMEQAQELYDLLGQLDDGPAQGTISEDEAAKLIASALIEQAAEFRSAWTARQYDEAVELGYRITGAPRYEDTPAGWAARERAEEQRAQARTDAARERRRHGDN